MFTTSSMNRRRALGTLGVAGIAATVAACSSSDPLANGAGGSGAGGSDGGGDASTIVVGSQDYYSNEIIAEIFAQVIEKAGYTVRREYRIGQREVYLSELESGGVDLLPEYTGNLLQFYDADAAAASPEEVYEALAGVLPTGLAVHGFAAATDQDSYTVTSAFSTANSVRSLADLAGVSEPLKVAANSELETRPFGPEGLKSAYGVDVTVIPVEDSGGPLTVRALTDGTAQLANIYSSSPAIVENDLVTLEDPASLILPQNVTPLATPKIDGAALEAIGGVIEVLTTADLVALNATSINDQARSADIAAAWLKEKGL
ncbi:MAG: ABC transporter substrate-binding protein [Dermabacter sp.]|nr:ABC transporter substrate-binding protein [Dermabacter sp.]